MWYSLFSLLRSHLFQSVKAGMVKNVPLIKVAANVTESATTLLKLINVYVAGASQIKSLHVQ